MKPTNIIDLYQNKIFYILLMIALLVIISYLEYLNYSSLFIRVGLVIFYCLLLLRYHFLKYTKLFLGLIGLLCLTSVFYEKFIYLLSQLESKKAIELYLFYGGTEISMAIILLLVIWSFLSPQKNLTKE